MSAPYRTASVVAPSKPRRRWRVMWGGPFDILASSLLAIVASSGALNAACFVTFSATPFVVRWLAVNAVALFVWALCFVRRVEVQS